jgi:hypothetical protein
VSEVKVVRCIIERPQFGHVENAEKTGRFSGNDTLIIVEW